MKIKNKIGYCDDKDLGIKKSGGHYVYINSVNKNGTCNVNVVTSLENKDKKFNLKKLSQLRKGNTYLIPRYDANFKLWTGVTKTPSMLRQVKFQILAVKGRDNWTTCRILQLKTLQKRRNL